MNRLTQRNTEDTEGKMNSFISQTSVNSVTFVCDSVLIGSHGGHGGHRGKNKFIPIKTSVNPVCDSVFNRAVDDALNPVFQPHLAEVEKETNLFSAQAQIGQNLFGMNGGQGFNGFQFYNNFVLNQQVGAKAFVEGQVIILDGDGPLPFHAQSAFFQFVSQHNFVDRLQQARAEFGMNVKRGVENSLRNVISFHNSGIVEKSS